MKNTKSDPGNHPDPGDEKSLSTPSGGTNATRHPWSRRQGPVRICLTCQRPTHTAPRHCPRPEHTRAFGVRQRYNQFYRQRNRARLARARRRYVQRQGARFRRRQREYHRQWYQKNRARKLKQNRRWDRKHRDERREYYRRQALAWYYRNHARALRRNRHYYRAHRTRKNARRNELLKAQRRRDPGARIRMQMRSRLSGLVRKGGSRRFSITKDILTYTATELRHHLERLFQPGMSWRTYGRRGWHVDHIIPCDAFDLTVPRQARACFALQNLRPLWWWENLSRFHAERRGRSPLPG